MTSYRRAFQPGGCYFFTVACESRLNNRLLVEHIDQLRSAFRYVRDRHPFCTEAIVIGPDHLHCIWRLPDKDSDYSLRWNLIKGHFSRHLPRLESVSRSRQNKRERGIWQRRFWEHQIRVEDDRSHHLDYIHWNPVKHGWVDRVSDWPYSSFHRYVQAGYYPTDWGGGDVHGQFVE